jgi:hypothetical protein
MYRTFCILTRSKRLLVVPCILYVSMFGRFDAFLDAPPLISVQCWELWIILARTKTHSALPQHLIFWLSSLSPLRSTLSSLFSLRGGCILNIVSWQQPGRQDSRRLWSLGRRPSSHSQSSRPQPGLWRLHFIWQCSSLMLPSQAFSNTSSSSLQ